LRYKREESAVLTAKPATLAAPHAGTAKIENLHEALVNAVPGIRFERAFCDGCGERLVRWSGADEALIALAQQSA